MAEILNLRMKEVNHAIKFTGDNIDEIFTFCAKYDCVDPYDIIYDNEKGCFICFDVDLNPYNCYPGSWVLIDYRGCTSASIEYINKFYEIIE